MNNKFDEILLKAEEGIRYEVTETDGGLLIRAINISGVGDYKNPPVPKGYANILGEWHNGFVIQDWSNNEFVWVPVGILLENGTLDGEKFNKQLGRRDFQKDKFSKGEFHEVMDGTLKKQIASVEKYGGFYVGRYTVSKPIDERPASVKDAIPWTNISFKNALIEARKLGQGKVESHLMYGAEFDTVLQWFLETGIPVEEIIKDSTSRGNYWNSDNSPKKVVETGSREEWYVNKIADLFGNVWEWTQEQNGSSSRVLRGGDYNGAGNYYPVADRAYYRTHYYFNYLGFRVALYIE